MMVLNPNNVTTLNESFDHSRVDLYSKIFDFLKNTEALGDSAAEIDYARELADIQYQLEPSFVVMSMSEREKAYKFINRALYQMAYTSLDYKLFFKFFRLWYASHRTLVTNLRNLKDPYYLTVEELDELIKGFGFPYPNKIAARRAKISFLYNLINYYKHKGTPYVFGEALQYFGLSDVTILEWWLKKNKNNGNLYFESKPVYPNEQATNSEFVDQVLWDDFFDSIEDVHWYQTKEAINSAYLTTNITLPSITPFITLNTSFDILQMRPGLAIIQEWMQETYTYWLEYSLNYTKSSGWDGDDIVQFINDPNFSGVSGKTYIVGTSPTGVFENFSGYYVQSTPFGWKYLQPRTNELAFVNSFNTHWVYNGESWVNLKYKIDSSMLDQTKRGTINRPITLSNFAGSFSVWEVMLAIAYLWNSTNDTTDDRYVYYNGLYLPFDKTKSGIRDNVIDDPDIYSKVYEEWDKYSEFKSIDTFTRSNRDSKYAKRRSLFQTDIDKTGKDNVLHTLYEPEIYLEALNPSFKEKLDGLSAVNTFDEVFGDLLISFENYLLNVAKVIDKPFVFFLFSSLAYASFKKVIDFWKPYRARIYSFEHRVGIFDRVENSQLEELEDHKQIVRYIGDQAPGRESFYDSSTILDSVDIEIITPSLGASGVSGLSGVGDISEDEDDTVTIVNYLFSTDTSSDKIYKHSGFSTTIVDSFSSPSGSPREVTWDGVNLYSSDTFSNKIYKHSGFSATISDSFSSPSTEPIGVTTDGTNMYSSDYNSNKMYKHSGFSNVITNSFNSPASSPAGLTWDGANLYSSDIATGKLYKHSGFSATISDSFSGPLATPIGITWDGTNFYSSDFNSDKIYKHSGFSSTLLDSFSSPSTSMNGLEWSNFSGRISE